MEVRSYQKGDEQEILKLFRLTFNQKMSYDYWKWRFLDNPICDKQFIQLMWDGDQLVGHYAISPIELVIEAEVFKAAHSMTTMTHPRYGGKGIFTQLAETLYSVLKAEEYALVWGFPNENSHYGFNKNLKWKDVATIPMLSLKAEHLKRTSLSVNYSCPALFTGPLASLLNRTDKTVSAHKVPEYLNWRYLTIPHLKYKIITINGDSGILVYKLFSSVSTPPKKEVDIMDIQFNQDYETLNQLLNAVLEEESEDIVQFNIWDSIFSKKHLFLEKIGFKMALPIIHLGYLNFDRYQAAVEDYKNWDINFGLSDVF